MWRGKSAQLIALSILLCISCSGGASGNTQPGTVGSLSPTKPVALMPGTVGSLHEPLPAPGPRLSGGLANPGLGINLAPVIYYRNSPVFLDHMKSAFVWRAQQEVPGGIEQYLDKDGWPTRLPSVNGQNIRIVRSTLVEADNFDSGRYILSYEGEGKIEVGLDAYIVRSESVPGRMVLQVQNRKEGISVSIVETDPRGTGNYIRNITVVKEEYEPLFKAGTIFHPDFLDFVKDFRTIRYMDWMRANYNPPGRWKDRQYPAVSNYDLGVPVEVMVALANRTGTDPWFTLPHTADREYMRRFAQFVRANLNPKLKAYFEISNETWNNVFPQTHALREKGLQKYGPNTDLAESQYTAYLTTRLADVIDQTFTGGARKRAVVVLPVQSVYLGRTEYMLNPPNWDPKDGPPPGRRADAMALTTYFGSFAHPVREKVIESWLSDADGGLRKAFREVEFGDVINDGYPFDPLVDVAEVWKRQKALADAEGLELIAYEGGQHVAPIGEVGFNQGIVDLLVKMNQAEEMGRLYTKMFEAWQNIGTINVLFNDVQAYGGSGSWGLVPQLGDTTPKYEATMAQNAKGSWWNEGREPRTFANGHALIDDGSKEALRGGPGWDTFVWQGNARLIVGEAGRDVVVLPEPAANYGVRREEGGRAVYDLKTGETLVMLRGIEIIRGIGDPPVWQ